MADERTEELRLWRYTAGKTAEPWVKERSFVLVHESYVPTCEKNYGITIGEPLLADEEILAVTRANSIGFWAEIDLMQRRVRIAKDDPDYQRLKAEAASALDKETASAKRGEATAIADAKRAAIEDAPVKRAR